MPKYTRIASYLDGEGQRQLRESIQCRRPRDRNHHYADERRSRYWRCPNDEESTLSQSTETSGSLTASLSVMGAELIVEAIERLPELRR